MSKKFNKIIEENMRRIQQNTLIVGDRVKFVDDFFNTEWSKSQPQLKLERLRALIEGGNNIRVAAVKTDRPQTAESGHFEIVDGIYYDVVEEITPGGGGYGHLFTVPANLVEHLDDYPNVAGPTPSNQVRENDTNIKPEEVSTEESDLHPKKQTNAHEGDLELTGVNTNIATVPAATSYTAKYVDN